MAERLKHCWQFLRPFTLLAPATGMLAGALMALGAEPRWTSDWTGDPLDLSLNVLAGALLAAGLNAYSNGVNQIFDVGVDCVNKPRRMLPSGKLTVLQAWIVSIFFLLLALLLAFWISLQTFLIVAVASSLTYIYSAPPLRTKSRGFLANLTVAVPRGTLLIVAGWSTVKDIQQIEPWVIGAFFGLFMLGAVSTKDFSDMEGDRLGDCRTLPVMYGVRTASWIISPFLVFSFLGLIPAALSGTLTGNTTILALLGVVLPVWGAYISFLLLATSPETFEKLNHNRSENHPSWKHMYLMMMVAQCGLAAAYLIR